MEKEAKEAYVAEPKKSQAVPEVEVQEQPGMSGKPLYCLGQHFAILFEYCKQGEPADFAQVCASCKYLHVCNFHWETMAQNLQETTGIQVSFFLHSNMGLAQTKISGNDSDPNIRDYPNNCN